MDVLAFDRSGPTGDVPVLLLHAGVADRRMWDPVLDRLQEHRDVLRVDLRGFGASTGRPTGALAPHQDVLDVLAAEGIELVHVVGASFGAGVAVEVALTEPALVASLLLSAPGGSLIPEMTDQLRTFVLAESAALEGGDLAAAVEANLATWVDGPGQPPDRVDPAVRGLVEKMQRLAFELTADWDDVEEAELDPPALDRSGGDRRPHPRAHRHARRRRHRSGGHRGPHRRIRRAPGGVARHRSPAVDGASRRLRDAGARLGR